jgi:uncharacterized membrane protein YdjX (TVP38/TMEM64 family)
MKRILLGLLFLYIICGVAWSYRTGGIMHVLLDPQIESSTRLALIQSYFHSYGLVAPGVYLLVVIAEVILAPIPGTLLYLPGGLVFGWLVGGSVSLAGNVLGAGIACQIARLVGGHRIERYLERPALQRYLAVIEARGLWIVFLLRINPLTSSDLVSYAAGLTRIPAWKVMAGTFAGMAPLCFAQAYFSQEIFTAFPRLIYPVILVGIGYLIFAAHVVRQLARSQPQSVVL